MASRRNVICKVCRHQNLAPIGDLVTVRCASCGYISAFAQLEQLIELPGEIAALKARVEDPDDPIQLLESLGRAALDTLLEKRAGADPVAQATLLQTLVDRDEALSRVVTARVQGRGVAVGAHLHERAHRLGRICQLLYGLILEEKTSISARATASPKQIAEFRQRIEPSLSEAFSSAFWVHQLRNGDWSADVDGRLVRLVTTSQYASLLEWEENRRALQRMEPPTSIREVFTPELLEAQRLLLGFDAVSLAEAFSDGARAFRDADMVESLSEHGYVLRLRSGDELLERMASALVLTRERVRRFTIPFFFDLGDERPPIVSRLDPLVGLVTYGWSTYYPGFSLESDGEDERVLISPQAMAVLMIPNIETFKGYLLDRLVAESRNRSSQLRQAVTRLGQEAHRRLEDKVLERGVSLNWTGRHAITGLLNSRIDAGEIDVILAKPIGGGGHVLVVEVKDLDFPLHKVGGRRRLLAKVAVADEQVVRKADWIITRWGPELAREFLPVDDHSRIWTVVRCVVTRDYIPPLSVSHSVLVSAQEWGDFLERYERLSVSGRRERYGQAITTVRS